MKNKRYVVYNGHNNIMFYVLDTVKKTVKYGFVEDNHFIFNEEIDKKDERYNEAIEDLKNWVVSLLGYFIHDHFLSDEEIKKEKLYCGVSYKDDLIGKFNTMKEVKEIMTKKATEKTQAILKQEKKEEKPKKYNKLDFFKLMKEFERLGVSHYASYRIKYKGASGLLLKMSNEVSQEVKKELDKYPNIEIMIVESQYFSSTVSGILLADKILPHKKNKKVGKL